MGDLYSDLAAFRAKYPVRTNGAAGALWEYFTGGEGEECILFLHGGMGNGEMYFEYMLGLQNSYRVIAPSIAAGVSGVDAALQAIAGILDRESVPACHVFGHSQGGYLALELARRMPELVRSVMVSSSGLPSPEHARKIERQIRLLRIAPKWLLLPATRFAFKKAFRTSGSDLTAEQKRFMMEEVARFSKVTELRRMALSSATLQLDYHARPSNAPDWKGPMLLLEAGRDGLAPPAESAALRARYPQAQVERFASAGHLDVMTQPELYLAAMRRFLQAI